MDSLLGYDILRDEPNRASDLEKEISRTWQVLGSPAGVLQIDAHSDAPTHTRIHEWVLDGRKEIADLKAWLDSKKGKLIPFWSPTWQSDIEFIETLSGSDIRVRNVTYARYYAKHKARNRLVFIRWDGSIMIREIMHARADINGTEVFTLEASFGAVTKNDFAMVCFLVFVRLASDEFEIAWHSSTVATVRAKLFELPQEVKRL